MWSNCHISEGQFSVFLRKYTYTQKECFVPCRIMEGWQDLQICASHTNIMNISNLLSGENAHKEKTRRIYVWTTQTSVVASDIHVGWSTHVIRCMRNPIWDLKEALGRSSGTWSRVIWLECSNMSQVPSASSWTDIPRNWSRFFQKVDSIYQPTRCHISKERTPKHNFVITITIFPNYIFETTQRYTCTKWR